LLTLTPSIILQRGTTVLPQLTPAKHKPFFASDAYQGFFCGYTDIKPSSSPKLNTKKQDQLHLVLQNGKKNHPHSLFWQFPDIRTSFFSFANKSDAQRLLPRSLPFKVSREKPQKQNSKKPKQLHKRAALQRDKSSVLLLHKGKASPSSVRACTAAALQVKQPKPIDFYRQPHGSFKKMTLNIEKKRRAAVEGVGWEAPAPFAPHALPLALREGTVLPSPPRATKLRTKLRFGITQIFRFLKPSLSGNAPQPFPTSPPDQCGYNEP